MICSNENVLKQEMELIIDIATKGSYKKYLAWNLYKKLIKKLNHIENAQKNKRVFLNIIPFNRYACIKIKNEVAKAYFHIPIKPNPNILQRIRNDRDSINPLETAGIYKIEYEKEGEEKGSYIGMTKRKGTPKRCKIWQI